MCATSRDAGALLKGVGLKGEKKAFHHKRAKQKQKHPPPKKLTFYLVSVENIQYYTQHYNPLLTVPKSRGDRQEAYKVLEGDRQGVTLGAAPLCPTYHF